MAKAKSKNHFEVNPAYFAVLIIVLTVLYLVLILGIKINVPI